MSGCTDKTMNDRLMKHRLLYISAAWRRIMVVAMLLTFMVAVRAIPTDRYASSSLMAKGRWRKVEVQQTGMQLLSNTQLKAMGFSDPSKVNVYGYGGRRISEVLNAGTYIDDLPMQPVVRTSDGLIFYGVNTIEWLIYSDRNAPYMPVSNPYSDHSYYFVSDVTPDSIPEMATLDWEPVQSIEERNTTFTERLLHKQQLYAPSNTGSWMLGEDFTQRTSQDFKFKLPGMASNTAGLMVGFGTRTSTTTSYSVSVDEQKLADEQGMRIRQQEGAEQFLSYTVCPMLAPLAKEDMTVNITYSPEGTVFFARLGFIEVCYERNLDISNEPLTFYSTSRYNMPCIYQISGITADTQIWDVTNPAAPARINYTVEDGKAIFSPGVSDYREYVAFNPSTVKTAPIADNTYIQNQDIHSAATPEMVIISPQEYVSQARRIAEMHDRLSGMDVYIVTPEALYNEFSSGTPDVSAYRKALKMWYDRDPEKLRYCLILGRPTYDQRILTNTVKSAGYPRPLIWTTRGEETATTSGSQYVSQGGSFSTDDFIAMLEDTKGSNMQLYTEKMSIAVGRLPFRSASHAATLTDKLIDYMENPKLGQWRNRIVMVADNGDTFSHFDQTMNSYNTLVSNGAANFDIEKIMLSREEPAITSKGNEYPNSKARFLHCLDQGTSLVWYIGHANTREWTHENFYNYSDICGMDNRYLPIFYTATCDFTRWDSDEISGGEILLEHPESGAIALLSTSREVYIHQNGPLSIAVANHMYERDSKGNPIGIGEALRLGKNEIVKERSDNLLRFHCIGDPAMPVVYPSLSVDVESVGGFDPDTLYDPDFPVFKGGGTIRFTGSIKRGNNLARDFNGTLYLTLYDAEHTVMTQEPDIPVESQRAYNERTNRLFDGMVNVNAGRWEAIVPLSADIENNFSPALLTCYAYSEAGSEAQGRCEKFYLYGMEENNHDTEGPDIMGIGLNSYNFKPGSITGVNPVFYASFTDPSGINLSSAGVGHSMELRVDSKKSYTDLTNYYLPSTDDHTSGAVAYPLSDLEPGKHTLTFYVYDNLGNQTEKTLDFAVTENDKPIIYEVSPDCNPARTSVTFTLAHDRLCEATDCSVSVYSLSGLKIWTGEISGRVQDLGAGATVSWDLCDAGGNRVPRGIYLYRATVTTSKGVSQSKTGRLAVTER